MKKLLNISVIAALAVLPVAANAQRANTVAVADYTAGGSTTALATTSYVQGAYEAASDRIDALVTDTAVAAKQEGNYAAIVAGDSVSENLVHLDDKIGTTTFEGASVSAAISALQTSAGNLGTDKVNQANNFTAETDSNLIKNKTVVNAIKDTAAQVDTNTGAITLLNGNNTTSGSVAYAVKNDAKNADYTNTTSGLTAGTIQGAIDEVEGRVDTAEGKIGNTALATTQQTLTGAINELNTAIGTLTSNTSDTYATKTGTLATINASTVPVVTTWGQDSTVGAVSVAAPNAYQAGTAPANPTVDCTDPNNASNPACTTEP